MKKRSILFMISCIYFSTVLFLSCYHVCEDDVDVQAFYAEENPLNPNAVTKLHIVLDKTFGPILVRIHRKHNYPGLMPDYPDSDFAEEIVSLIF